MVLCCCFFVFSFFTLNEVPWYCVNGEKTLFRKQARFWLLLLKMIMLHVKVMYEVDYYIITPTWFPVSGNGRKINDSVAF